MSRLTTFLRDSRLVLAAGLACALALSALWLLRSTVSAVATPVPVAAGDTGTAGGAQWRLRDLVAVDAVPSGGSAREPVPGAVFVLATFEYRAAGGEVFCTVRLAGQGREWTSGFHTPTDEQASAGCDGRPEGTAEVLFEIPRTAVGEVHGLLVSSGQDALLLAGRVQ